MEPTTQSQPTPTPVPASTFVPPQPQQPAVTPPPVPVTPPSPVPPTVPPTIPTAPAPSSWKKFWAILVLMIIIAGVLCYVIRIINSTDEVAPTGTGDMSVTTGGNEILPTATSSEWQTYNSVAYGFELKYPKSWVLATSNNIDFLVGSEECYRNSFDESGSNCSFIKIAGYNDIWVGDGSGIEGHAASLPSIVIGNNSWQYKNQEFEGVATSDYFVKNSQNKYFHLQFQERYLTGPSQKDTFIQILSNFKFTK